MFKKKLVRLILLFFSLILFAVCVAYGTYIFLTKSSNQRNVTMQTAIKENKNIRESVPDLQNVNQDIQTDLKKCSIELQNALEILNSMHKIKEITESYTKTLLVISNIEKNILNNKKLDISGEISSLNEFIKLDIAMMDIMKEIANTKVVYGRKYFEQEFSKVVKHSSIEYHKNYDDAKILSKIKRAFFGSFVLLSPSGDELNSTLYDAHLQLKTGNMIGLYDTVKSLKIEDDRVEIFLERLESYNKIMQKFKKIQEHIERTTTVKNSETN